jgi:protein-S-isoprenylcysteine O-methyltransferase Ste14
MTHDAPRTTVRTRKLIGTVALLALIVVYCLLVMGLIATVFPQMHRWVLPFLYAAAGIAWVPLAGAILNWMHRGRPDEPLA